VHAHDEILPFSETFPARLQVRSETSRHDVFREPMVTRERPKMFFRGPDDADLLEVLHAVLNAKIRHATHSKPLAPF